MGDQLVPAPDDKGARRRRWARRRRSAHGPSYGSLLLSRELDRSRRHGHPLALVQLPASSAGELDRAHRAVELLVRSVDGVWLGRDAIFVLLPETDRTRADGFVARVRAAAPASIAVEAIAVVCFPDDGLTSEALRLGLVQRRTGTSTVRNPLHATSPSAAADAAALVRQPE